MARHLKLTIAEPCHEDWEKMTDTEKGKYCGACQKQVVDFTGMTDAQLTSFFKRPIAGSSCGRFYTDQLEKQILIPRKRIPWVRYFFQFTLPLFLTTFKLNAQKKKAPVKTVQSINLFNINKCNPILVGGYSTSVTRLDQKIQIKGKVLNEEGKPIPFANIEKGMGGTVADSSGVFSINLVPDSIGVKLVASCIGYEPQVVSVKDYQITGKEEIVIILKVKELQPAIVTSGWRTISGNFVLGGMVVRYNSRSVRKKVKPVHFSSFKIYSNPARANSAIFIKPEKVETGLYVIQLLNLAGQSIKQEEIRIEKGMGAISFTIPAIPSGVYMVNLVNKKTGGRFSEELIVQ
jgi:hypothetical protein